VWVCWDLDVELDVELADVDGATATDAAAARNEVWTGGILLMVVDVDEAASDVIVDNVADDDIAVALAPWADMAARRRM
jgi:hypothetical protein